MGMGPSRLLYIFTIELQCNDNHNSHVAYICRDQYSQIISFKKYSADSPTRIHLSCVKNLFSNFKVHSWIYVVYLIIRDKTLSSSAIACSW